MNKIVVFCVNLLKKIDAWIISREGFLLFLVTFFLVLANWRLVSVINIDRHERLRPYLNIILNKEKESYFCRVGNLGGSPAYDIEVYFEHLDKKIIKRRLCQKYEFERYLGHETEFTGVPADFEALLKYRDGSGKNYFAKVDLNWRRAKPDKDKALLEAVEKISESLRK